MDDWTLHEGNRLQEQMNKYSQQMALIPELVKSSHMYEPHCIHISVPGCPCPDVEIPEEIEGAFIDLLNGCYKRLYDNAKKEFEDL